MPHFEVQGSNKSGRNVKIYVECDTAKTARSKARSQGIIPIKVKSADSNGLKKSDEGETVGQQVSMAFRRVSFEDVTSMTRQLATLVKAHVPVVESLSALIEQIDSDRLRPVIMSIRQNVKEGHSLGDSFAMYPTIFNRVYVNMVRAGESSGKLDVVLNRLADFAESQVELKSKIKDAMMYPLVIMVVAVIALVIIFMFVVPKLVSLFEDMDKALPTPTVILIGVSEFVQQHGVILVVGGAFFVLALSRYLTTKSGRARKDRSLLKAPTLKKLVQDIIVARFTRTLGVLLDGGVPMLNAMDVSKNVVNNVVYEEALIDAAEQVSEGHSLLNSLKRTKLFPPIVLHMIGVGEKTGELEKMLINVADSYDQSVKSRLATVTSLLGPIMIVVMVMFVGFIVMAVLMPIFEMNEFT